MVKPSITIEGATKTALLLTAQNSLILKAVDRQISSSVIEVKTEVKASIQGSRSEPRSVDTGEFLNSVNSRSKDLVGEIFSEVPQSKFMEFGTSKISPRHHFRNSLERKKKKIEKDINSAINNII